MITLFENIKINVRDVTDTSIGVYMLTPEESLSVMINTALGSRVGRPTFGSEFYRLVDENMSDIWILRAKKMILECTRCSVSGLLWDDRVEIKNLIISCENNNANIEVELV